MVFRPPDNPVAAAPLPGMEPAAPAPARRGRTIGTGAGRRSGRSALADAAPPGGDASVGSATVVYTDGACRGNPGPGGWAWAVPEGRYASGAEPATTNQRMEITAVLRAVETLEGPLVVVSDSTYVVNCFRDRWWSGWRRRAWRNAAGQPVANRDLWEPLIAAVVDAGREIRFQWVKGHSGDVMNDRVDLLATRAADTQAGVVGP